MLNVWNILLTLALSFAILLQIEAKLLEPMSSWQIFFPSALRWIVGAGFLKKKNIHSSFILQGIKFFLE